MLRKILEMLRKDWTQATRDMQANQRIRELHHPFNPGSACDCCVVEDECDVCGEYYPCQTIKALDGEQ